MTLLSNRLISERPTIMDNGIRLTAIGELDLLPKAPKNALFSLMRDSAENTDMTLCLCLSYGGREEIVHASRKIAEAVASGSMDLGSIDESTIDDVIWSSELGPVDLLIRTSGEQRISNFLLWQLAYAELFFSDKYWPEFDESALDDALLAYGRRDRRFGQVK